MPSRPPRMSASEAGGVLVVRGACVDFRLVLGTVHKGRALQASIGVPAGFGARVSAFGGLVVWEPERNSSTFLPHGAALGQVTPRFVFSLVVWQSNGSWKMRTAK